MYVILGAASFGIACEIHFEITLAILKITLQKIKMLEAISPGQIIGSKFPKVRDY